MANRISDPFELVERGRAPVRRVYAQALMLVLLVACIGMLVTAVMFRDQLAMVRTAEADEAGWVISQIETDFAKFQAALAEATLAARVGTPDAIEKTLANLRKHFDIYYSRVDIFRTTLGAIRDDAEVRALYTEIRSKRGDLAVLVDGLSPADADQLARIDTLSNEIAPIVRDLALATLHLHVQGKETAREGELRLFYRFFIQSVGLSFLIALGAYLVARLWRELEAKSEQMTKTVATVSKAFSSTLSAVIVSDRKGIIIYANARATEMFGYEEDELIGFGVGERIVPDHLREQHDRGMQRFLEWEERTVIGKGVVQLEAKRKNGEVFPVELSLTEDQNIDGTPIILGFLRDISAQVKAEENLRNALANAQALAEEAEKHAAAKGTFLATMSHEMRTPLHGLIASLDLIDDSQLKGDNVRFLSTARDCSARALKQVNDVLEFTRLGESQEQPDSFEPDEIVAGIINELRPLARSQGTELVSDFQGFENAPPLVGRPFAFSRALYNLAGNAVKFTRQGRVTIQLKLERSNDGKLLLHAGVADTGVGIAPEDQKRIFQKFETSVRSEISDVTGTGLGLPIAAIAVEKMGGKLQLSSTLGFGSRFFFSIPLETDVPARKNVTEVVKATESIGPMNVLVVDDNEVNVTLMTEMVRRLGHTATPARNGKEAVQLAGSRAFDVIFMDFSMPVMDGPEAARRIRTGEGPSAKAVIIGVTALITANDDDKAELTSAMDAVLIKPVGQSALEKALLKYASVRTEEVQTAIEPAFDLPDDENEDEDDGSEIFDDLVLSMGEETGFRLIAATLADAELAVAAMEEVGGDLTERAHRIHKAVGSTGMTGMQVLSQTLSAAEVLALDGGDPSQTHLPRTARDELARITKIYNHMTHDFVPAG